MNINENNRNKRKIKVVPTKLPKHVSQLLVVL